MIENKRDHTISMLWANVAGIFIAIVLIILQFVFYHTIHGIRQMEPALDAALLIGAIVVGILIHELIHGITWMIAGDLPFSAVRFGFQWKTITPYAHLKEPVEVNAYRIATFMPGLLLGIIPYIFSLLFANGGLFWFGLVHTSAASGDWLILWLIRNIKAGSKVEDHPTRAGCYVIET